MKKLLMLLIIATLFHLQLSAQSVWGKDINTTITDFMSFVKKNGHGKPSIDKKRNFCRYEGVEFAGQKFSLNVFYSATNDSIKSLYFAKSDTRPKIYRDESMYSTNYTLLVNKYKRKYPKGKETSQTTWEYRFENGGSIQLFISEDKSCIGISYISRYKEELPIEKVDNDI